MDMLDSSRTPSPLSTSSHNQATTMPHLPEELRILIIDARLAQIFTDPCPFRSNIINILKEQRLMRFSPGKDVGNYLHTDHLDDEYLRWRAFRIMDRRERRIFTRIFSEMTSIASVNTWCLERSLLAQRRWLSNTTAMSFREFQAFCSNSEAQQDPVNTDLVIQLFTQQDFLNPPPEMNDQALTIPYLRPRHRLRLRHRNPHWYLRPTNASIDEKLYHGMINLWVRELERLPGTVKNVWVIYKKPWHTRGMVAAPGRRTGRWESWEVESVLRFSGEEGVFAGWIV